uniref:Transcriptional repressor rco-1 n=1 Tax=Ganoderma boninense TaxID=34458 RepID=A0A5K1K5Z4_9APHY|nr:Transcriptional repressor rco-1 [Ganoderma boninense]
MSAQIKPGHTYRFTNGKGRMVLDLSMADFKSVAGGSWVNGDNQKWVAERPKSSPQAGATRWTFRNVATGLYLGVDGAPKSAGRIVATRTETEWDVRPDREDPSALR